MTEMIQAIDLINLMLTFHQKLATVYNINTALELAAMTEKQS